jgi:hypothetical protein
MNVKQARIEALIEPFRDREHDARYLAYFACFNRGQYYEAHEVLEALWLTDRDGPNGGFYKGLIQLTGAFVHAQKQRRGPAIALLRLAQANLQKYFPLHEQLDVAALLPLIASCLDCLACAPNKHDPSSLAPHLALADPGALSSIAPIGSMALHPRLM